MDIPFVATVEIENPFDVRLGALLTHESGKTMDIPAFYDDENTWILRICPSIEGRWNFKTYSSVAQLAGLTGRLTVTPNTKKNAHGPLIIAKENPQRLAYEDGTPYFLMAFELDWLFALDWDNQRDIPKTKSIISAISSNGFNQVIMNVYAYDANWGEKDKIKPEHNFSRPRVFPFGGSNEQPDYSTLNIDFFKHLDRVIAHLNEQGVIAHLMIYVWNKNVNWPEPNSRADNLYFDYVVKRYQAFPNLIWDISKEALGYGHNDMKYISEKIDRLRHLSGHRRLLTVHDYAYCSAFPEKVDFISIQEWRPNLYNEMLNVSQRHANQPVFNIEHGGYEKTTYSIFDGAYTDPIVCLNRNYECVFAGTYSCYYWQNTSWYNVIYNPSSLPKEQQPAFRYYKNLVGLFEKYGFNTLRPTQFTFTPYCLTDDSLRYLFYLPQGLIALQGDVPALRGKKVATTWFDPLSGSYYAGEIRDFQDGSWIYYKRDKRIHSPFCIAILEIIQ